MSNNVNQQDFTFDDLEASGGMGGGFGGRMAYRRGLLLYIVTDLKADDR